MIGSIMTQYHPAERVYDERPDAETWEEDERGAERGDPRCCPHHPHVQTSSPDGMFNAPCGECELEDESKFYDDLSEEHETKVSL